MSLLSVQGEKVIKKYKGKDLKVRKWSSNSKEFCWVDMDGKFWRWSFKPNEDPEVVFKLHAKAPNYWLSPLSSPNGEWYAMCGTDKERRTGMVHCYPADNGEARIFDGPSSATFINVMDGPRSEIAISMFSLGNNVVRFVKDASSCSDYSLCR